MTNDDKLKLLGFKRTPVGYTVRRFQAYVGIKRDDAIGPITQASIDAAMKELDAGTWVAPGRPAERLIGDSSVKLGDLPFCDWFAKPESKTLFPRPVDAKQFEKIFDQALVLGDGNPLTIGEMISYFCIFYNETGGTLRPLAELGGPKYCFETNGGAKASYNVAKMGNRLAGDQLLKAGVIGPQDVAAWNATVWPNPPVGPLMSAAMECDFYKYRGHGLMQTTWRDNHRRFVDPALEAAGYAQTSEQMPTAELDEAMTDERVYLRVVVSMFRDPGWIGGSFGQTAYAKPYFWELGRCVSGSSKYADLYEQRCEALFAAYG